MFNKLKNRKAFTLMEMLIVVAIIAILVAIAIPTFNAAMAKSRAATDLANIRSGYAAAVVAAMTDAIDAGGQDYFLQADGSVSTTEGTPYECKGTSEKAAADSTIGGKFSVNSSATDTDDVDWAKGQVIKYHVTPGTDDTDNAGVPVVDSITATAKGGN